MTEDDSRLQSTIVCLLVTLSVVGGAVAFAGGAAAATNTAITPDDDDAGATNVQYTAEGNVELGNQDTLQYVDVNLGPANVSQVDTGDIDLYVDGNEYTDGFTEFSATNGTVEFKLSNSQSLSDGDPVRVVVGNVTNPADDFDGNVTLHDTGDDRFQTFRDHVSIDTPADVSYGNLTFDKAGQGNETTLNVGEDLTVSATVENTGEQNGTYNASLVVDGSTVRWQNGTVAGNSSKTVSFVTDWATTGEHSVAIDGLAAEQVTITGQLEILDGTSSPHYVDPGQTVNDQRVYVDVGDVSQDGDTDWHYVEFPNELAGNLSVNSVDANATSITSSPNLVEGFDNDGIDDTVKFATSGDGGGDVDLNLTVDVSVTYPSGGDNYPVDVRVVDSDGDVAQRAGVTVIEAGADVTPNVTDYSVTNPSGREVRVSFDADEQLSAITVDVTDGSGTTVATLDEGDFTECDCSGNGTWMYHANYTAGSDGSYTATLTEAADADGNDGSSEQSGTVDVSTPDGGSDDGSSDDGGSTDEFEVEPRVTDVRLVADGGDVDVVVDTNVPVTDLSVDVGSAVDVSLVRDDFASDERDGSYVYTADVADGVAGTYHATVESVAVGDAEGTAGQTDSLAVVLGPTAPPAAMAEPPWTGASDSVHTFAVPVDGVSSLAGEPLERVSVEYGDAFLNTSGSISSVSDDQNVVTLLVVDENGTVTSRMGGTDAVSVNVATDAVHLDLTDVDSARTPTLSAGDRVVVQLSPVTNPATAGTYDAAVTLETASGTNGTLSTDLRVLNRSAVAALDTGLVVPDDVEASFALDGTDAVGSVAVDPSGPAAGPVRVTVPDDRPATADSLSREVVTTARVTVPEAVSNGSVQLDVAVPTAAVDGNASSLALVRYDDDAGEWVRLPGDTSRADGTVTVHAAADDASLFAVTAASADGTNREETTDEPTTSSTDEPTDTPTDTATPTDRPTDTPTDEGGSGGSGFPFGGVAISLLAMALAAGAAGVHRYRG